MTFIRGGPCMSGLPRSSHALVTGGGRGIGREIAAALARAGATVTVLGRNRATLDDAIAAGCRALRRRRRCRGSGRRQRRDRGSRGAAADRYPDCKCRHRGIRAVRKIRCGAVSAHDGCQLHGRGSCRPGRVAVDEGPAVTAALSRLHRPPVSRAMPMSAPTAPQNTRLSGWCARWRWNWQARA